MTLTSILSLALLAAAGCALAAPKDPRVGQAACGRAASFALASATDFPEEAVEIPARAALECLQSVPLDRGNTLLLDEYARYMEWQSNTAWLARPPAGYTAAHGNDTRRADVLAELSTLREGLARGEFRSEWAFQTALHAAVNAAYDNHLSWNPDIMTVFAFARDPAVSLVSASLDGRAPPALYLRAHVERFARDPRRGRPEPVVQIDGREAGAFLAEEALRQPFHDGDARHNAMMFSQAGEAFGQAASSGFEASALYLGDETVLTLRNGSAVRSRNRAVVLRAEELLGVRNGRDFFDVFCSGPPELLLFPGDQQAGKLTVGGGGGAVTRRQDEPAPPLPSPPEATGYPRPFVMHSEKLVAGFFPEGVGLDDAAVLTVAGFGGVATTAEGRPEFREVVAVFMDGARRRRRTRLVLDVRGNGGGFVELLLSLWKQLLPEAGDPFEAGRMRATPIFRQMAEAFRAEIVEGGFTEQQAIQDALVNGVFTGPIAALYSNFWNHEPLLTADGDSFDSFDAFFGPNEVNGDQFTAVARQNLSSPLSTVEVTGYGRLAADLRTPAAFTPENMVVLADGVCSSACAHLLELLKDQGGVEVVAVGGARPDAPMQAIGGTKGGPVLTLAQVHDAAAQAATLAVTRADGTPDAEALERVSASDLGQLVGAVGPLRRCWNGAAFGASVNPVDTVRRGDAEQTPLEFVYEAADCRLYYTPEMLADVTSTWKAVYDAKWGENGYASCAPGSTGHESSVSGGFRVNGKDIAQVGDGGGGGVGNETSGGGSPQSNLAPGPLSACSVTAMLLGTSIAAIVMNI